MDGHAVRVAGFGMRAAAGLDSLRAALALAGEAQALAALPAHAARVRELADALRLPLLEVTDIAGIVTPTVSAVVVARFGTGSVAEAVALAAAGPRARIIAARVVSPDRLATAAIAEAP